MNMALGKERIKLTVQLGLVHTCLYKLLCCKVRKKKSESVPTLVTSWTIAHQAPLSMEFSRQEPL